MTSELDRRAERCSQLLRAMDAAGHDLDLHMQALFVIGQLANGASACGGINGVVAAVLYLAAHHPEVAHAVANMRQVAVMERPR